jgi:hypothetical protein
MLHEPEVVGAARARMHAVLAACRDDAAIRRFDARVGKLSRDADFRAQIVGSDQHDLYVGIAAMASAFAMAAASLHPIPAGLRARLANYPACRDLAHIQRLPSKTRDPLPSRCPRHAGTGGRGSVILANGVPRVLAQVLLRLRPECHAARAALCPADWDNEALAAGLLPYLLQAVSQTL